MLRRVSLLVLALGWLASPVQAGLYYSGEPLAELPSQWRGYLLDQRALRMVAVPAGPTVPASPLRERYLQEVQRLEKAAALGKLTADELADLGALYIRLGQAGKAVELLRTAQREHPQHFRILANLGTAWQLENDLNQSAACLEEAVRLAPGKFQKAEEAHLKLVRLRARQPAGFTELDDLFGLRYLGPSGQYEAGKLAVEEQKKLPADAVAIAQQLALWLPADARLLWQLAELANAHGDVRTAAAIMDGCVTEFGLASAELRRRRQLLRAAADELARLDPSGTRQMHEGHAAILKPRSKRPLLTRLLDPADLPPINPDGVNNLPWALLAETQIDRHFKPTFARYLQELDGKQVSLAGFMQPIGEQLELAAFMLIEYPVGCWYCEVPEATGIVFAELPPGKTTTYTRGLVKVTGTLKLNSTDPENFLYLLTRVKVAEAD
jgi:hypothetical protein